MLAWRTNGRERLAASLLVACLVLIGVDDVVGVDRDVAAAATLIVTGLAIAATAGLTAAADAAGRRPAVTMTVGLVALVSHAVHRPTAGARPVVRAGAWRHGHRGADRLEAGPGAGRLGVGRARPVGRGPPGITDHLAERRCSSRPRHASLPGRDREPSRRTEHIPRSRGSTGLSPQSSLTSESLGRGIKTDVLLDERRPFREREAPVLRYCSTANRCGSKRSRASSSGPTCASSGRRETSRRQPLSSPI